MSHGKNGGNRQRPGGKFPTRLGAKPKGKSNKAPLDKGPGNFDFSGEPKHHSPRNNTPEPAARPNQRLGEFTIERFGHDGRGITQWQGKTLFVDGALPGETVTARFVAEHGRYAEAVTDHVLVAAPERQTPPCVHYHNCGGCQLQHLVPATQIALKQTAMLDQLQRWAGLAPARILPPVTSSDTGYRNCARMGVWYERDGSVTLGFRRRYSKNLVAIANCLVLPERLNALLAPLHDWLTHAHTAKAITHVELLDSPATSALVLRHTKIPGERDLQGLRELAKQYNCMIWLDDGTDKLRDLNNQPCDPRLSYSIPAANLAPVYHPQDFMQVNPQINTQMIAQALQLLDLKSHERVLDLFCGIGNFTLPIAQQCAEVIGVEAVESMVARGRENAARARLSNVSFMASDLTKLSPYQLQQRCGKIDAVLLDPPRDGAKEIAAHIGQLGARRIVYVSCNPATLARDAKILADSGYQLEAAGVLDMFPHTQHVESMALFVRG